MRFVQRYAVALLVGLNLLNAAVITTDKREDVLLSSTLQWLHTYGYVEGDELAKDMSPEAVREAIKSPLKKFKEFYNIQPADDGIVNEKVLEFMQASRCGDKDLETDSLGRSKRWTRANGSPWRTNSLYLRFFNYHPSIERGTQDKILHECAKMWSEQSNINFRWRTTAWKDTITVYYNHIDRWGPIQAKAYMPSNRRYFQFGTIDINLAHQWKPRKESYGTGYSLKIVMCHELGHTLGLGHSPKRSSIMYAYPVYAVNEKFLDQDDLNGIRALFGPPRNMNTPSVTGFPSLPTVYPTRNHKVFAKPVTLSAITSRPSVNSRTTLTPVAQRIFGTTQQPRQSPEPHPLNCQFLRFYPRVGKYMCDTGAR